jgi:hypothetical protein
MELTTGGIIFLSLAWGGITLLTVYCFIKVIKSEKKNAENKQ